MNDDTVADLAIIFIFLACVATFVCLLILSEKYFRSEEFKAKKKALDRSIADHNELAYYANSLHTLASTALGESTSGKYAHLATSTNTSRHNYRRNRHIPLHGHPNVFNGSLQIVQRASAEPIKYLMKYFDLDATEENLCRVEELGNRISRLEGARDSLELRESDIIRLLNPPWYVTTIFSRSLLSALNLRISEIRVDYPQYQFQYVSPGGNSSQVTTIILNPPTIDALIETMSRQIRFRKTVAGQRALMTSQLRTEIKERDGYRCCECGVSIVDEPHLLLEIDHIIPLSKGGMTTRDNLQTLCWKCNRSKSNKIYD